MLKLFRGFLIPLDNNEPMRFVDFADGGTTPQDFMESEESLDIFQPYEDTTWLMENEDTPGEVNDRASILYNAGMQEALGFSLGACIIGNVVVGGEIDPETRSVSSVSESRVKAYKSLLSEYSEYLSRDKDND